MLPSHITLLKGVVHNPSNHGDNYYGFDLRKNEMEDACKALTRPGVSVLLRHKYETGNIGTVHSARIRPADKALEVVLAVDTSTTTGREAVDGMRQGRYMGLSLGFMPDSEADLWGVCEKILINEISICPAGARPDCDISKFHVKDKLYLFKSIEEVEQSQNTKSSNNNDNSNKTHIFKQNTSNQQQVNNTNFFSNNTNSSSNNKRMATSTSRIDLDTPPHPSQPAPPVNASAETQDATNAALNPPQEQQQQQSDMGEDKILSICKKLRMTPEQFYSNLEQEAQRAEQEEIRKRQLIDQDYERICREHGNTLPYSGDQLKQLDYAARAVLCGMDGNYARREAARAAQEENVKQLAKGLQNENENLKKELSILKGELEKKQQTQQMTPQATRFFQGVTNPLGTGAQFSQGSAPANTNSTTTTYSQVNTHAPPPNVPVNASGQRRKAGLVIEEQEESCFDSGFGTPNPMFSFDNLLQRAYDNPKLFSGLEKGPRTIAPKTPAT
jgi:hypothetical protein